MNKTDKKNPLHFAIEVLLIILMALIAVLTVTLYWTIPAVTACAPGTDLFSAYLLILAVSGVVGESLLWQARGILHNVNYRNPFCTDTVRRLRICSVELLLMAAFFMATVFWLHKFYMILVFCVCALAGLILSVFAALFRQAIAFKEENDMTI